MKKIKIIAISIVLILIGTIGFLYLKRKHITKMLMGLAYQVMYLVKGIAPDLTPEKIQALLQR